MYRSGLATLTIFLFGLVGCSEVSPTNPFDPKTPTASRAKMSVTGKVVRRSCGEGPIGVAVGATIAIQLGDETIKTVETDENGHYIVDGLIEGEYVARVSQERYIGTTRVFAGKAGSTTTLDEVTLEPERSVCQEWLSAKTSLAVALRSLYKPIRAI